MRVRVPGSMPLGEAEGACDCVSKQASRPRSPNLTGELNHLLVVAAFIERTPAVAVGGRPAGRTRSRRSSAPIIAPRPGPAVGTLRACGIDRGTCFFPQTFLAHARD